jgi:hypothetical protein
VEAILAQGCRERSAHPRTVGVQDAAFVISRESIVGFIPDVTHLAGVHLEWLWYALPILCAPEGWQTIHASAAETEQGVLLICGGSGSGKTTLLLRLLDTGRSCLFSEDIVLVDSERGLVRAWEHSLHLHPHQVPAGVDPRLTLDFTGKIPCCPQTHPCREVPSERSHGCSTPALGPGDASESRDPGLGFWIE